MQASIRLIFLCSLIFSSLVRADSVLLNNGDRLTGSVLLIDAGKLLLKTEYAGTVSIATDKISSIETEQPFSITPQRFADPLHSPLLPAEPGHVQVLDSKNQQLAISSLHQAVPLKKRQPLAAQDLVWTNDATLALDFKRQDRETDSYDLNLNSQLRHAHWRHQAEFTSSYETRDDEKQTDKYMLSYSLDRFLTEQFFWQGKYKFNHDQIDDLRKQHRLGTGPGYQFWDNELGALSATTLLNYQRFTYDAGRKDHFSSAAVSWDYRRYLLARTLTLFNRSTVDAPLTSDVDYVLNMRTGLSYKINSWASLDLTFDWEKVSGRYTSLNDRRYLIGLGINW